MTPDKCELDSLVCELMGTWLLHVHELTDLQLHAEEHVCQQLKGRFGWEPLEMAGEDYIARRRKELGLPP